MKNSEDEEAEVTLDALLEALDPQPIRRMIDLPADIAGESFSLNINEPANAAEFTRLISEFVQAIYQELPARQHLPFDEAFALTCQILDQSYGAGPGQGYDLAITEIVNIRCRTIEDILETLLDGIKERERSAYRQFVYGRIISFLRWNQRCALVRAIARRAPNGGDDDLLRADPERFADLIVDLIDQHIAVEQLLSDLAANAARRANHLKS